MELYWTPMTQTYFETDKEAFKQEILKKIPTFIENNYYRIKPIHSLAGLKVKTYELRMHIGKKDYRVAFAENQGRIIVFYVSPCLQKVAFEKEIKKWVHRHSDFLDEICPIEKG